MGRIIEINSRKKIISFFNSVSSGCKEAGRKELLEIIGKFTL